MTSSVKTKILLTLVLLPLFATSSAYAVNSITIQPADVATALLALGDGGGGTSFYITFLQLGKGFTGGAGHGSDAASARSYYAICKMAQLQGHSLYIEYTDVGSDEQIYTIAEPAPY